MKQRKKGDMIRRWTEQEERSPTKTIKIEKPKESKINNIEAVNPTTNQQQKTKDRNNSQRKETKNKTRKERETKNKETITKETTGNRTTKVKTREQS